MDLTQDVTYPSLYRGATVSLNNAANGASGTPSTGRTIDSITWESVPGVGYTEKRAQASGNDAADIFDGALRIHLTGTQYGATDGDLDAAMRELRSLFSPEMAYKYSPSIRGYLPLTFHEKDTPGAGTWASDDITMILYCRPIGGPSFVETRATAGGNTTLGGALPWRVSLEAKDPTRYNATASTSTVSTGTSGSMPSIANNGDRFADGTLTLTVPTPGAAGTVRFIGSSADVTITTEAAGTRTYVLGPNHLLYVTEAGATTLRMDLLSSSGSKWPNVPANTTLVPSFSSTVLASAAFTLALSINEAFS